MDTQYTIGCVLLISLLVSADGRAFWNLFWFPYLTYIKLIVFSLKWIEKVFKESNETWKLGYRYKFSIKALRGLYQLKEVEEAMKGIRFEKPHDYVCKCDNSSAKEDQTIFQVRFLTAKEQAEIRDIMYSVKGVGASRKENFLTGSSVLKALELGLKGWKNFKFDDTGDDIPFTMENFSCIPPTQRDELASYIRGIEEGEV